MVFIPAPRTVMIELVYSSLNVIVENTLYFQFPTEDWNSNDIATLAGRIYNWWDGSMREIVSVNTLLTQVRATSLNTENGYQTAYIPASPRPGNYTSGTPLPNNVTYTITFVTAQRGRAHRGRNYMVGLRSGSVSNDTYNQTHAATGRTAYQRLLPGGTYDPTPYRWVVMSKYLDGVPRSTAFLTPVIGVRNSNIYVKSMRKRLPTSQT